MSTRDIHQDQQQELIPLAPGEFLRQRRLLKKLSLASVAEAIKLDEKLLHQIEMDEAGHIAAVYRKGYITAYARFLDVPQDEIPALSPAGNESEPVVRNIFAIPPTRNPMDKWLRATSYVLASLLIGTLAWQFTHEAVRLSQGGSQIPLNQVESVTTEQVNGPVNASIVSLGALHDDESNTLDTAKQAWAAVSQSALPTGESRLQLSVSADSWIEISDTNGVELEMDLLRGGSEKSYHGKPPFRILFGRASAIRLFMDGEPVDLTAHTVDDVAQLSWPMEAEASNLVTEETPVVDQ
jgi:cytoskeleton protein RodZ